METLVLEIRHLKTLHALREADSLVEAAERLHLTQSALSHQFKELEERMGMPLFVRKTKPVRFTSAGLRLLQLADATLPLLRAAERDISRLAGGTAGQTGNVPLGGAQQRQGGVRQLQQAQAGAGEAHRLGLAHEQWHAHALFQFLELVGQGGLGQVQAFGGFDQAVGFAQGVQGLQVTDFEHQGLHE